MKRHSSFALGFLALIAIGAFLLCSPFARTAGGWGDYIPALFTAASAVCVTGLTVVDIAREYTLGGQIVLIALVELGCLGLIAFGTFLTCAIGQRMSLSRESSLMNAYGVNQIHGLKGLFAWVICSMAVIEAVGTVALHHRFHDWYKSFFYSVMGFCNAGFGLLDGSLSSFANDPYVLSVESMLTIFGGIGFLVIYNICIVLWHACKSCLRIGQPGGPARLSLHTRVVLRFTLYLLAIAFVAFLLLEWNGSLKGYPLEQKLSIGFYQAVTPRTCGFSVIPTESLNPLTRLVYEVLMFIGGAPGSAAAGLKVTTFAVLIYTIRAMWRGETETTMSKRLISNDTVREAIVIFMALISLVVIVFGALLLTESANPELTYESLMFESVSALTTTGLSCGQTTGLLSTAGRFVIIVAMFLGRLGALSVVMWIGERESVRHVRFPSEALVVG